MKQLKLIFLATLAGLLFSVTPVKAQSSSPPTSLGKYVLVNIRGRVLSKTIAVAFDTGGEPIGGLGEAALNEKFAKVESVAAIINYVVQNGYKVMSFSLAPGPIAQGTGGGVGFYVVLFEKVK